MNTPLRALALFAVPPLLLVSTGFILHRPPTTGGGWVVEYNANGGKVTVDQSTTPWDDRIVTDPKGWYADPNQVGGNDHPGTLPPTHMSTSVTSAGSPEIRLRWTAGQTDSRPSAVAWLLVDSIATWTSTRGRGKASNGYGDPLQSIVGGERMAGKHVVRLTGGAERVWSRGVSAFATATSAGSTQAQVASAGVNVVGSLTDKYADLARTDGGGFNAQSKDDTYVADTLLSWDTSDNVQPGPNGQTLTGTYGGTWSKKPDGTNDVAVVWRGATFGGWSPVPVYATPSTYPPTNGDMPLADGSGSPKTQDWVYSVKDSGDDTQLDLTCHWICHYAYEGFAAKQTDRDHPAVYTQRSAVVASGSPVHLTSSHQSENSVFSVTSYTARSGFSAPGWNSTLPGFQPYPKHIGIQGFSSHANDTNVLNWPGAITQQWSGDGTYTALAILVDTFHNGDAAVWNRSGNTERQVFRYKLASEATIDTSVSGFTPDAG